MKFKEKASSIALSTILMAASIVPVNAYMKEEIAGSNRYETAAKVADRMGNYSTAILVNGNSIADGLSASGLAGKENAPILLVKKDSIPKETLQRLYKVKKVYIIGKENAVSSRVGNTLNQAGISTKRLGGNDRISTSLEVAREIGNYSKAFLVNGMRGEADAMSVASVAARDNAPIILTNGKDNPTYKMDGVKYYVVGGNAVMANNIQSSFSAERLSGSNRYTTNKEIVNKFYPDTNRLYFAKGDGLVDALTVSPLTKNNGLALVGENSDKSIFFGKENLVQVGGMNRSIVDKVLNSIYNEDSAKPDENNPENDIQKPENKPNEKTYDINSPEFQKIVRDEFYRLLDAYRAANGKSKIEHHWACEESAMLKSKHMINNNYFGHYPWIESEHLIGAAENIAGQWVSVAVTREEGLNLADRLFNQWRNSPDHNELMLDELSENIIYNGHHAIDGFAFYAKPSSYSESFGGHLKRTGHQIYMIKATYHSAYSGQLWNTSDTTNELSPGYQPKNN